MTRLRFALLALALLGLGAVPGLAAPIDYDVDVPLVAAGSDDTVSTLALRGTLSYDGDDAMTGGGRFSVGDESDTFEGFAYLMDLGGGGTGILFDGASLGGAQLYFNIASSVADAASGVVHYCGMNGCAFYQGLGASVTPTMIAPPAVPGSGSPLTGLSPVPLPPAGSLFGGALLALAGVAVIRRSMPRYATVRR